MSTYSSSVDLVGEQLAHARGVLARQPARASHASSGCRFSNGSTSSTVEPGGLEERAPLVLRVGAHVRRVAQLLGLLDLLARVERVLDDDERRALTRAISATAARDVVEVVRRDPRHDEVEGAVGERQSSAAADHVRLHPRRRIGA